MRAAAGGFAPAAGLHLGRLGGWRQTAFGQPEAAARRYKAAVSTGAGAYSWEYAADVKREAEATLGQLNAILGLIEEMQAVDTDGVEPMSHPQDVSTPLRVDLVSEGDQRSLFQSVAPKVEDGLYLVPKVIE